MRIVGILLALMAGAEPRGAIRTPVELPLPAGFPMDAPFRLVHVPSGREVPVQIVKGDKPAAAWIHLLDGPEKKKEEYRLEAGAPKDAPRVEVTDVDGKHLDFSYGGKKILRYNYGTIVAPPGVDPVFSRSGYLHPIWTPSGKLLTNDFPAKHLHHHGIWFPWTSAEFEGRKSDFWNSKEKQGKVECVKVEDKGSGPVFGWFRAKHRFLNLNGPDGPKAALDETWEVRVYAVQDQFILDLLSVQTCATDRPLVIRKFYYGGLGFRGSNDWEGKDGCEFRTSEGKTRADGNETTGRWCVMSGKIGGQEASIAFLGHPSNFRFPQGMRLHPSEPFFNFAPSQGGDFSIEPGKPYVSRFRFVVADQQVPVPDEFWQAYAQPPVSLSH
jgi:hypothetical protein